MTVLTEGRFAGEYLVHEGNIDLAREAITVLSGEGKLGAGTVIGRVAGAVTQSYAGTGNGVLTPDATTPKLLGVQEGAYRIVCIEPGANVGTFAVYDPAGVYIGSHVVAGAAFATQIKFAIADGATDFIAGDAFSYIVAAGTKWRSADPTNTDGSGAARGILFDGVDATAADAKGVATTGHAVVNGGELTYDAAVDDAPKKATKNAELKAVGIIVR